MGENAQLHCIRKCISHTEYYLQLNETVGTNDRSNPLWKIDLTERYYDSSHLHIIF